MKKYWMFLKIKFELLKDVLVVEVVSGGKYQCCSVCFFKVVFGKLIDEQIEMVWCYVCDYEEMQFEISCLYCLELIVLMNEGFVICLYCDKQIELDDVVDVLLDFVD